MEIVKVKKKLMEIAKVNLMVMRLVRRMVNYLVKLMVKLKRSVTVKEMMTD
jgi:hypothetical protein